MKKYFLILSIFFSVFIFSEDISFKYYNLTPADGLSQGSVNTVFQDDKGFIWIGTENGLNMWDGKEFKIFRKNFDENKNSVSHNYIKKIIYDSKNKKIIIATWGGGINFFDPETNTFTNYSMSDSGLSSDLIYDIADTEDYYWIGSHNGGLDYFDKNTGIINKFDIDNENVNVIFYDNFKRIWVGTDSGIVIIDGKTKYNFGFLKNENIRAFALFNNKMYIGTGTGLYVFDSASNTTEKILDCQINTIYTDKDNFLWVGTYSEGIYLYISDKKYHLVHDKNKDSVISDSILSVFQDKSGAIWIGTTGSGLSVINTKKTEFDNIGEDILGINQIWDMEEDINGKIWIATNGHGIEIYDPEKQYTEKNIINEISDKSVWTIMKDYDNNMWIGTNSGLDLYNFKEDKFINLNSIFGEFSKVSVWSVFQYDTNTFFIGTRDNGFFIYNKETGEIKNYHYDDNLSSDYIYTFYKDSENRLWIGTIGGGLVLFDKEKETFKVYKSDFSKNYTLSNDFVLFINEDDDGRLWIGTNGGGLNVFYPDEEKFLYYTVSEGLPDDVTYGFLEDNIGNYWISTNKGLSKFNKITGEFRNYNNSDGILNLEFNGKSFLKTADGKFYFGGTNGITTFYPQNISVNNYIPDIAVTELSIMNNVIEPDKEYDGRIILSKNISYTDNIELSYSDKIFSFRFSSLNYINSDKNKYAYKLENFDDDWVYSGNRNYVMYTNIKPGNYIFKVKGSNNDGVWNENPAEIKIKIIPPFYSTFYFYLIVVITVIFMFYSFYKIRMRRIKRYNSELQKEVFEKTKELKDNNDKLTALNTELRDFAYIVSHDLKAPLRGINQLSQWIVKDYGEKIDQEGKDMLRLLENRTKRMNSLINGILEYSRVNRKEDENEKTDLNEVVKEVIQNFSDENIQILIDTLLPVVKCDRYKISQVFQNLISNSVKYMDKSEGIIKIGYEDLPEYYKFYVSDNGPGIDEIYFDKIFKIFQTLESKEKTDSTGIGLAIVKKIIEGYDGKIYPESEIGKGTKFIFTIKKDV